MANTTSKFTRPVALSPLPTTLTYYIAFIGLGMVSASLGPTISALADQTQVSLSQISYLFTARSLGFMLGAVVIGRSYDRIAGHPVITLMLLLIAGMMALVPTTASLGFLIPIMFLIGIGMGGVDLGGNTLLVWLHRERVGPYMNGLHFIWGAGAFLAPIIVAQTLVDDNIRWAYWLLAVTILPVTLWLPRLTSPQAKPDEGGAQGAPGAPLLLGLVTAFFFLCVGAEVSVSGWIFTYTVDLGLADETSAAYLNSAFFGAITAARLLAILMASRFSARQILLVDLVICLISVGVITIFATSLLALWIGVIGLGVGIASMFPTLLDLAQKYIPVTGKVTSWFFLGASSGGMILPWLIGQFFERVGPQVVVAAIWICLSLATVIFVALSFIRVPEAAPVQ